MSEYTTINNNSNANIYIEYMNSQNSFTYTYIPTGSSWTTPSGTTFINILDQATYNEKTIPIVAWQGEYETQTNYWGQVYSPLIINNDGTVSVAGQVLEVEFDEENSLLTWDWQQIGEHTTKASITFSEPDGEQQFAGTINPQKKDGPVSYTGVKVDS